VAQFSVGANTDELEEVFFISAGAGPSVGVLNCGEPAVSKIGRNCMMTAPIQPRNPLHGLTLEAILNALVAHYGWAGLGERIPVRCFTSDPSIPSSLKFLRKTPWAREKVEGLYLFMWRDVRRAGGARGFTRPGDL
jgi:hypothetical protein